MNTDEHDEGNKVNQDDIQRESSALGNSVWLRELL